MAQQVQLTGQESGKLCDAVRHKSSAPEKLDDVIKKILATPENQGRCIGPDTFFPTVDLAKAISRRSRLNRCRLAHEFESPFLRAAELGNLTAIEYFLAQYGDVIDIDRPAGTYKASKMTELEFLWGHEVTLHGCTALQAACIHKCPCGGPHFNTEVIKYLVSRGASVNLSNCYGMTPLMGAARNANIEAMECLLEHGANLQARTVHGETALHVASFQGHVEAIRYLVKAGLSVSDRTVRGFTPLHFAAGEGHLEAVKELLVCGASPDFCRVDSSNPSYVPPPILMAACKGHKKVVDGLLTHPECTQEHKVDALLLLGIASGKFTYRRPGLTFEDNDYKLWREALALRDKCKSPPNLLPPIKAYGGRVELQTVSEFANIMELTKDEVDTEMYYQKMIIFEKCIGLFSPTALYENMYNFALQLLTVDKKYTDAELLWTKVTGTFIVGLSYLPTETNRYDFSHGVNDFWSNFVLQFAVIIDMNTFMSKIHFFPKPFIAFATKGIDFLAMPSTNPLCKTEPDEKMLQSVILLLFYTWIKQQEQSGTSQMYNEELESSGSSFVSKHSMYKSRHVTRLNCALSDGNQYRDYHPQLISALLRWGADAVVNMPNSDGSRPLHLAAQHSGAEVIQLLLDYGAHLDAVDKEGQTATDIASKRKVDIELQHVLPPVPLSLYCLASHAVVSHGLPYAELDLPTHVKDFVSLHDKNKAHQ